MCGIYVSTFYDEATINLIKSRGTDFHTYILYNKLHLFSSVLSIRGSVCQPVITEDYILLYNGEIYNNQESDTIWLSGVISNVLRDIKESNDMIRDLNEVCDNKAELQQIYDNIADIEQSKDELRTHKKFSKDKLRTHKQSFKDELRTHKQSFKDELRTYKQSSKDELGPFKNTSKDELRTHKKFSKDKLRTHKQSSKDELRTHKQSFKDELRTYKQSSKDELGPFKNISKDEVEKIMQQIYLRLGDYQAEYAIAIIYENVVMFFRDDMGKKSLGLSKDKFCLSSVNYDIEINNSHLYSYNIQNKSITSYKKHTSSVNYLLESSLVIQRYLENNCEITEVILHEFMQFLFNPSNYANLEEFDRLLKDSVKTRMSDNNLVVFFSGGIDSQVIALYLHLVSDLSQNIYLLNTGFSNSHDRMNGKKAFDELKKKFWEREWFFIEVELNLESIKKNKNIIESLIYPHKRIMDLNLGIVLYFTALEAKKYSKVCYLGSGADELFCGYNKYKKDTFRHHMVLDTISLSYNNLSRDDRVISSHNIEARLPFLDTKIINYSFMLPEESLKNNKSNKVILRHILRKYELLSLSECPKKAMQYGTGLSKFEKLYT